MCGGLPQVLCDMAAALALHQRMSACDVLLFVHRALGLWEPCCVQALEYYSNSCGSWRTPCNPIAFSPYPSVAFALPQLGIFVLISNIVGVYVGYWFITVLLHNYTTKLLYYYIIVVLYYYTTILLYYYITILLYYYIIILLYYYMIILIYKYNTLSQYYYINALPCYSITISICDFVSPLLHYYNTLFTLYYNSTTVLL